MSTDILTQLQTTYTQLLTQFYSTLSYLSQRHPLIAPEPIPGEAFTSRSIAPAEPGPEDADPSRAIFPLRSDSPEIFEAAQKELAEDLVLKTKQIQQLIVQLPGLGKDENEQARDIQKLVEKVEEMEKARRMKRQEMKDLARRLEAVIEGMNTSVDTPHNSTNIESLAKVG